MIFKLDREEILQNVNNLRAKIQGAPNFVPHDTIGVLIWAMSDAIEIAWYKAINDHTDMSKIMIHILDRMGDDQIQAVLEHVMTELDRRRKIADQSLRSEVRSE